MKPKEFIAKYGISTGWRGGIQNRFIEDMSAELNQACEDLKVDNLGAFTNAVKVVSSKWTAISNKIPFGIPEQIWKYFYATVICPKREELCPSDMKQVREEKEQRDASITLQKKMWKAKNSFYKLHEKDYKSSSWATKPFEVYVREEIIKKNVESLMELTKKDYEGVDNWEDMDSRYKEIITMTEDDQLPEMYLRYCVAHMLF